jgi:N-acetylgalactosamine-N,N'-diacetylbacillosaminyl-diphospho-undecaprenol 4-alpha-N-acetylgalactosaminyltransferase
LILENKAENHIFLLGFKKNVYKFINKSSGFISSSNYEDPGFALIEACFLKKKIITSLVDNGPLEMFQTSDMCYFFEKNNEEDFVNKIILSENDELCAKKILNALKFSKEFSLFSHYQKLINLIS